MIDSNRWTLENITTFSNHLNTLEKKIIINPKNFGYENEISFGKTLEEKVITIVDTKAHYDLFVTALKVISLQYRISFIKRAPEDKPLNDLMKAALKKWKNGIPYYIDKEPTPRDLEKIKDLSRYTKFIPIMLKNGKIQDEFFKLVFRDNFPIKMLIHYYNTCSLDLKNALLSMRIGFFNKFSDQKLLRIEKSKSEDGTIEKDLQFFMNKKFVSVLNDENKIKMNDGLLHTWKEIKKDCIIGRDLPAIMEVFEDSGLVYFKPQGLKCFVNGVKMSVDTKSPKFWEGESVPTFLTLSKEQLEAMLNIQITEEKPCVATVEASCLDPFQVKDSHGASTIYLKAKDGRYRVFPFGKYAEKFPQTSVENACFIGNSVKAELTYPDPTPFYSQRVHGVSPLLLSVNEAEDLLAEYGKSINYFQFSGNNCSADFQRIFEGKFGKEEDGGLIPNYFRLPLLESKFFFPANFIFEPLAGFSSSIASLLTHAIHILFGSKREFTYTEENGSTKTVSLYKDEFCETQQLYVPGQLIYRILTGEIKGVTWFGYD